jgi:hypothetical protein
MLDGRKHETFLEVQQHNGMNVTKLSFVIHYCISS